MGNLSMSRKDEIVVNCVVQYNDLMCYWYIAGLAQQLKDMNYLDGGKY